MERKKKKKKKQNDQYSIKEEQSWRAYTLWLQDVV